ncbi:hypothetical protein S40285_03553 [Stachybotrys chlorohalonatus IBT 40285]|uniref:DCG1 protein n=1 Tax=Stachybotrys chlorohalonatus (strain IBT 40285) TaxID=1283841 RepID=A0A084QVH3_STAC4|nr:hypothetical protein S40285_03553 [Stachybotrys chlorohalonata IBT 40285]
MSARILVLNPNSSEAMTKGMTTGIASLSLPVEIDTYTAPPTVTGSIDDDKDLRDSTEAVLKDVEGQKDAWVSKYDGILVACYSHHPLVSELGKLLRIPVLGIFEASIMTAQSLLLESGESSWGIVTTGKFWEQNLSDGVRHFLGREIAERTFAGVFSSGLKAGDFHNVSPEQVNKKLREAAEQLLRSRAIGCVVMGCAGMAGLETIIRDTVDDVYAGQTTPKVYIVDGVKAGVMQLEQIIHSKKIFG